MARVERCDAARPLAVVKLGAWPHADRSRRAEVDGQAWHWLQWPAPRDGAPRCLLLHGTGASSHSWQGLAPLLARDHEVIAVDLPGHGRSGAAPRGRAGVQGMARAAAALMVSIGWVPQLIVGHSAGAAVAVQMALDAPTAGAPLRIVSVNGALLPLPGLAGQFFSPLAKLLALNPFVPHWFAWRAWDPALVRRMLRSTGSTLDDQGTALYQRLVADPRHVAGALAMMAQWDLPAFSERMQALRCPLQLIVGELDGTVPPASAAQVQRKLLDAGPGARVRIDRLPGLGHLAHEEDPAAVMALLESGRSP